MPLVRSFLRRVFQRPDAHSLAGLAAFAAGCGLALAAFGGVKWLDGLMDQPLLLQLFLAVNLCISLAAVLQVRKLKQAADSKADFLASMSHDIRTPMNGVIGFTDLLQQGDLTDEQRRSVDYIAESGHTMVRLLNDILDFSRMEAGGLELDQSEVDLHDELAYSVALFEPRALTKGITLVCDIDPEVPERIVGDPLRLRQILLNLVGNAVKFTDHGNVTLSVHAQRTMLETQLTILVSDTGIGIPAESLERIFETYVQAGSKTTRERGGTGLGLAISSQLIGLMEGHIDVASEHGKGTVFTVRLPVHALPPVRRDGPSVLAAVA